MHFVIQFIVVLVSGFYTSLWGAFKDGPYEGFKPKTFLRSVYFHVAIFLPLYFLPYFQGKAEKGPRREIMYFAASGMLNAIRVDNWKVSFAIETGPISEAYRSTPFDIGILLLSKYIS